jgi:hypothetical protein
MELPVLSFSPGLKIQEDVWNYLGLPICYSEFSSRSFALVVAFGHCKYHLTEDSVSLLLEATIGGEASRFHVIQLSPRVFKFLVNSKPVGIYIRRLFSFECKSFKLFFHFWGVVA